MKNIKYICALLLPVIFLAVSCKEKIDPNQTIKMVESMSIEPADLVINVGDESVINLKYMPQGAVVTGKPEWHYEGTGIELMPVADNPSQSSVKCTNTGNAKIYATLKVEDKEIRSSDCNVTMVNYKFYKVRVKDGWVKSLVPLQEGLQLGIGDERASTVGVCIDNEEGNVLEDVSWKYEINSGSDLVSIEKNNVGNFYYLEATAKKVGEATVTFTATTADGVTMQKTVKLTINKVQVPHDYTKAEVGDIMLKDGKFLTPGNLFQYQKDNAIGVVVLRYYFQDRVGASVKAKLGRDARGLVMALNNAGSMVAWSLEKVSFEPSNKKIGKAYRYSYDGYSLTNNILSTKNLSDYPAFKQVKEYRQNHETPSMTTEWYMPSIGEWGDLLSEKGIGGFMRLFYELVNTDESYLEIPDDQETVYNNLNNAFKEFSNADKFEKAPPHLVDGIRHNYSSSSDYNDDLFFYVDFAPKEFSFSYKYRKYKTHVRCVLAF